MFVTRLRRQVGWFVMLGFGAIILMVLLLSLRTDMFAKKFYLTFSPPSANALYVGQPVTFQGFAIGHIDSMALKNDGSIDITMKLLEHYHSMLHGGITVHLVRDSFIGEQKLEITAGDKHKPMVKNGQNIAYLPTATIEQLLQQIKPAVADANILLSELSSLATWMNNPDSDIRQITARLNAASHDLNRKDVGKLMQNMTLTMQNLQALSKSMKDQHIAKQLAETLKASSNILSDLQPLSAQIAKQGPASMKRINSLIGHVDQLSRSLDIVSADLSELTPELPGLARESRTTLVEMRKTLTALQGSWLLGNRPNRKPKAKPVLVTPSMDMRP